MLFKLDLMGFAAGEKNYLKWWKRSVLKTRLRCNLSFEFAARPTWYHCRGRGLSPLLQPLPLPLLPVVPVAVGPFIRWGDNVLNEYYLSSTLITHGNVSHSSGCSLCELQIYRHTVSNFCGLYMISHNQPNFFFFYDYIKNKRLWVTECGARQPTSQAGLSAARRNFPSFNGAHKNRPLLPCIKGEQNSLKMLPLCTLTVISHCAIIKKMSPF